MPKLFVEVRGAVRWIPVMDHCCVGGGASDELQVAGLDPGTILARPARGGVVLEASVPMTLGQRSIPPSTPRLVREHDRVLVDGAAFWMEPDPAPDGTRALATAMLAGCEPIESAGPGVIVVEGAEAGRRFAIGDEAVVGRGGRCDIRITDPLASRRHLRLEVRRGAVFCHDLRSRNGVSVDGRRIGRGRHRLHHGDEVRVGSTLLLVESGGASASGSPGALGADSADPAGARSPSARTAVQARDAAAVAFVSAALLAAALLLVRAAG